MPIMAWHAPSDPTTPLKAAHPPPAASVCDGVQDEPAPDPSCAPPIVSILQDEEAATMCCVGSRGGVGASMCNTKFRRTFFRDDSAADTAMAECSLPIFKYAK